MHPSLFVPTRLSTLARPHESSSRVGCIGTPQFEDIHPSLSPFHTRNLAHRIDLVALAQLLTRPPVRDSWKNGFHQYPGPRMRSFTLGNRYIMSDTAEFLLLGTNGCLWARGGRRCVAFGTHVRAGETGDNTSSRACGCSCISRGTGLFHKDCFFLFHLTGNNDGHEARTRLL